MKEIMTVKQVARYLQMNEHTIYRLARAGEIPSIKISGQWRFKKDLIDRWITEASIQRVRNNDQEIKQKKARGIKFSCSNLNVVFLKYRNL